MTNDANPYQRVIGPIAGIPTLLQELGADPVEVFAGLSLRPADLVLGNLVPYTEIYRLLARSAEITDCPHFGLLLGAKHDHRSFGILGEVMANMPSLGEALREYVSWQIGYSHAGAAYLYRAGKDFVFGYGIYERDAPGSWQVYDLTITVARNMVSSLSGGLVHPDVVFICHRPPENSRIYEQILGAKPWFDQSQNCLVLTEEAMATGVPGSDPLTRTQALEQMQQFNFPGLSSVAERARHFMRASLSMGDATMNTVARQMGLHRKTLERRLMDEATSFETIRDEVRYAMARNLLDLTDLPVLEIAAALSYATLSAFDHAFKRWSGLSPSEWRARYKTH
jgi:AraC-like DNA-binding protein